MSSRFSRLVAILGLAPALLLKGEVTATPTASLDLVFIGDSITAGAGVRDRTTQAAPVIATQALQKQLGDNTVVYMSNQGKSGFTTVNFLPGGATFSGVEAAAKDLEAAHPGRLVFSIMLGTNDSANSGPKGSPVSADDYAKNLEQIIDKLMADYPGSKFVIHHPIWHSPNAHNGDPVKHSGADYEGDSAADRLKSYFPAIDSVVGNYATSHPSQVYLGDTQAYDYFAAHQTEFKPENGQKGIFYLHPNATGAQSLGGFWATALAAKINP
jgi:lysophospholipase L1-like esterase